MIKQKLNFKMYFMETAKPIKLKYFYFCEIFRGMWRTFGSKDCKNFSTRKRKPTQCFHSFAKHSSSGIAF